MTNYEKCALCGLERGKNSLYGNPSYYIYFTNSNGAFHKGKTASNSMAGYDAGSYWYVESGSPIYLRYHYTKGGKCIIDEIKHQHPEEAKKEAENDL